MQRAMPSDGIQQLLVMNEFGDLRLTQLLRRMQVLLGDRAATFDEHLLRELFLQRLPALVQMLLATRSSLS